MADDMVEEEERVVISVTTGVVNVAIQPNMPTVIIQDRTSEYMSMYGNAAFSLFLLLMYDVRCPLTLLSDLYSADNK